MIQYGLISGTDATTIQRTFDLIFKDFDDEYLNITEVGIFDGQTARGIREYVFQNKRGICYTAIDNCKDKPVLRPFEGCNLIIGNSNEVYNQLEDNSQHFIFIDGCHALPAVISDFFCYSSKVKNGGYFLFHDTGKHIKALKDFQRMGSESDQDMYISVRKALNIVGLLFERPYWVDIDNNQWKLIFDEADETDEAGGICVFKKLS